MALAIIIGVGTGYVVTSTATTTTTIAATSTTTSTTIAPERHQVGWTIVSASGRGVMVDIRNIDIGGVIYRAVRLRARTTLLHWHVGAGDPTLWAKAPPDAGPKIDWSTEGRAGVIAVFNGGFKQAAGAGGAVVDGLTLNALVKGDMTIVLDRGGHWEMGVWGTTGFPTAGFNPIAYRQNLKPLVWGGRPTAASASPNGNIWGSPLHYVPQQPRTGLGVDAQGNLIYVASMQPALAHPLAQALAAAGAVTGMELDINPFWPILGASSAPIHRPGGTYAVQLVNAQHSPNIYDAGWERDFFVALAEPSPWTCNWESAGLRGSVKGVQPQPIHLVGQGCPIARPHHAAAPTTATTPPSTTVAGQ